MTTAGSILMCLIPAPSLYFLPSLEEVGIFFVCCAALLGTSPFACHFLCPSVLPKVYQTIAFRPNMLMRHRQGVFRKSWRSLCPSKYSVLLWRPEYKSWRRGLIVVPCCHMAMTLDRVGPRLPEGQPLGEVSVGVSPFPLQPQLSQETGKQQQNALLPKI